MKKTLSNAVLVFFALIYPYLSFTSHNLGQPNFERLDVWQFAILEIVFVIILSGLSLLAPALRKIHVVANYVFISTSVKLYTLSTYFLEGSSPTNKLLFWTAIIGVLFVAFNLVLRKNAREFSIIATVLVLVSSMQPVINIATDIYENNEKYSIKIFKNSSVSDQNIVPVKLNEKPNIYLFLFDAYVRPDVLKEDFAFEDKGWSKFLYEHKFRISTDSYSNFPSTIYSVNLMLNPQLLELEGRKLIKQLVNTHENSFMGAQSTISTKFNTLGYRFGILNHLGTGKPCEVDFCITTKAQISYTQLQYLKTTAIYDVLRVAFPFILSGFLDKIPQNASYSLDNLPSNLESPFLLLTHLLLPHPPYAKMKNCDRWQNREIDISLDFKNSSREQLRDLYLNQVSCANLQMKNVTERILQDDPDAIIIFFSDHGWKRSHTIKNLDNSEIHPLWDRKIRHASLFAVRAPENCFPKYNYIMNVDIFPQLLSCLTGNKKNLLPRKFFHTTGEIFEDLGNIF